MLKVGDKVLVKDWETVVRLLKFETAIGVLDSMEECSDMVGVITRTHSDFGIEVDFGGRSWWYTESCLELCQEEPGVEQEKKPLKYWIFSDIMDKICVSSGEYWSLLMAYTHKGLYNIKEIDADVYNNLIERGIINLEHENGKAV